MNFQDQIQQIFGTTDIHELKQISRDAGKVKNPIQCRVVVP